MLRQQRVGVAGDNGMAGVPLQADHGAREEERRHQPRAHECLNTLRCLIAPGNGRKVCLRRRKLTFDILDMEPLLEHGSGSYKIQYMKIY